MDLTRGESEQGGKGGEVRVHPAKLAAAAAAAYTDPVRSPVLAAFAALILAACQHAPPPASPQDAFFARLTALCGKSFGGRLATPPTPADVAFTGKALLMQVRDCSASEIRIPFRVGEDRSRTWVVTRTGSGLRLKHDHRHADGGADLLTQYGGDTTSPGDTRRQEFPIDDFSKALFQRQNSAVSMTNVWAMEVEPGRAFTYELARPGRLLRVEFDLTRPLGDAAR